MTPVINKYLIIFCLLTCVSSCKEDKLGPDDYIRWVENPSNGLVKHETIGKVKYTVMYRPGDYQMAKGLLSNDSFSIQSNQVKNHSFIVKMDPADGKTQVLTIDATDKQEPFQRINYYLSEAQNYISLVEGEDTLAVENYIYERYYNVSPSQNLVIGFRQQEVLGNKDLVLMLEDKIFNTGIIYFHFDASTLKEIPTLITQ